MIAQVGSGWQTVLADLSLILFMTTAAAVSEAPAEAPLVQQVRLPVLAEPVAVWRGGRGAPTLNAWLAEAAVDQRLRLTLVAAPKDAPATLALAAAAQRPARVLIEPDLVGLPYATLTYDNGATP